MLISYTSELALRAGEDNPSDFAVTFVDAISANPDLEAEYINYLSTGKLDCKYSISGYTLADIVIWQMDHFKALLDNQLAQNKSNPYKMTLMAFDTMLKMSKAPEKYITEMQYTTGTDRIKK